jgi:hypothetical protein
MANLVVLGALAALMIGAAAISRKASASGGPSTIPTASTFGAQLVEHARSDLGVVETSPNGGPRIDEMLGNYGFAGQHVNWCAAATGTWVLETARAMGISPPIRGSAGAKNTMEQMQDLRNPRAGWIDVAALRANPEFITSGMLAVWTRGPTSSHLGHIGVVEGRTGPSSFMVIAGNAGANADRVLEYPSDLGDPDLLGMGYFNDAEIFSTTTGYLPDPTGVELFGGAA